MNRVRSGSGAIVVAILALLVLAGANTAGGQSIISPLWQSLRNLWRFAIRDISSLVSGTSVAGNLKAAVIIGLAIFAATTLLKMSQRTIMALSIGVPLLLYAPTLLGNVPQ